MQNSHYSKRNKKYKKKDITRFKIKIKWKTYPETVGEDRRSDKLVFRCFRQELIVGSLVKQYHVVHLFLLLSLAPLLQNPTIQIYISYLQN